jgi:hypothetical protein
MHLSPDQEVAAFIEAQLYDMGNPFDTLTAPQVFRQARERFGDFRLIDAAIWIH